MRKSSTHGERGSSQLNDLGPPSAATSASLTTLPDIKGRPTSKEPRRQDRAGLELRPTSAMVPGQVPARTSQSLTV
jgi:hypothetical protein